MPTNQQRREAERRRLQQQLEERRAREAARKRTTLIASIVGTVALIAVVIIIVAVTAGGGSGKKTASSKDSASASASPTPTTSSSSAAPVPTKACIKPQGAKASFAGLTVTGATDLKHEPKLSGKSSATATALRCVDLVVGKGPAAKEGQSVTVEYVGAISKTGKVFQSSWSTQAAPLSLTPTSVIPGFYQGIAGGGKLAPMHVGGRRLILIPAAAGYGANPPSGSGIPANADLAFIVDLQKAS